MNFSSDLCTLGTLNESTLLWSLEQRCKDNLTESYVGSVLLNLGPSSKISGPQFLPSFASSVLRSLAFSCQDQSILIGGYHTSGKNDLSNNLLSSLLSKLEAQFIPASSVITASELLECLTHTSGDKQTRAVMVTTLVIHPENLALVGAKFSCLLLDTCHLSEFEVFKLEDGLNFIKLHLKTLGMDVLVVDQVCEVFGIIRDILTGVGGTFNGLPVHLFSEDSLAQLLYSYLVQWIVIWLNSKSCLGPHTQDGKCGISLVRAPGHTPSNTSKGVASTLTSLVARYSDEVLHNIYCTRLFVWEQEQYQEEGITWDTVEVEFNQNLISTFHQDGGLIEVLGKSSSIEELRIGVNRCCQCSGDSCFMVGNDGDRFALAHFTGECEYVINCDWLETNKAYAMAEVQSILMSSACNVLVEIAKNMNRSSDVLPNIDDDYYSGLHCSKLIDRAKLGMDSVLDLITTSQPHFVICFQPSKSESKTFDCDIVLNQLQQFKILDIALIQSCGYPIRIKHSYFIKNYGTIFVDNKTHISSEEEKCRSVLTTANVKEWHVGKTMVILKPWHLGQLDSALDLFNQSAKKLQQAFRRSIISKRDKLKERDSPPSPPPRPMYTLAESHTTHFSLSTTESVSFGYEKAAPLSNYSYSPKVSPHHRKKLSWKKKNSSSNPHTNSSASNLPAKMWFQGKLSREKAEDCLKGVQFDCFLVRESENRVGEYALSLRHKAAIKHFRIDCKRGGQLRYELYGAKVSFPSIEVLVDYYSHHCISSSGELLTVSYSPEERNSPVHLKRKLSSIRRPKPSLMAIPINESRLPRHKTSPNLDERSRVTLEKGMSLDISEDSIAVLRRELEVEERIVEAARRMAELPNCNRRERQKRKQSLHQAQSRLLSLRQQFHTVKERKLFIELSMQNTSTEST